MNEFSIVIDGLIKSWEQMVKDVKQYFKNNGLATAKGKYLDRIGEAYAIKRPKILWIFNAPDFVYRREMIDIIRNNNKRREVLSWQKKLSKRLHSIFKMR